MKRIKVFFDWTAENELKEYLRQGLKGTDAVLLFKDELQESEITAVVPEINVLVCWRPSQEMLDKAEKLSVIINPGAGVQHLKPLAPFFTKRHITLINGHGNSYFTAQHGIALLLSLMNRIIPHHNAMTEGKWRLGDEFAASLPLRARRIGLLGYGHVNRKVHKFLSGFDVSFSMLRRKSGDKISGVKNYLQDQKDDFFRDNDIIIIAVPLTEHTKSFVGERELELLGPNGLIVNIGRGEVVKEEGLYYALNNKTISGAAIDVWYNYRPEEEESGRKYPFSFPFNELDNIILSPHRAASPLSDLKRWDEVIENISRISSGRDDLLNVVDTAEGY
jgi:phosphoglycerate dehydrogenase-like enzyme